MFIPIVLQGLHSGKKSSKNATMHLCQSNFLFFERMQKRIHTSFYLLHFHKELQFFCHEFCIFFKSSDILQKNYCKTICRKKSLSKKKKSMALTFAYLPARKHMHVFENTQTYIRVDKKLSEVPNTHREGFIL